MTIKKGLLTILFLILFTKVVYAGVDNMNELYISKQFSLEDTAMGQSFFLFSSGYLDNCQGDIYIVFSDVKVGGSYTGNIHSFLSTIKTEPAPFTGKIFTFSSKIVVAETAVEMAEVLPFFQFLAFHMKRAAEPQYIVYNDIIPNIVFQICFGLVMIMLCFIFLPLKKSFFEQCGASLIYEPIEVIKNGLTYYFITIALSLIFFLSIVGFPVMLAILLLAAIFFLLGETALSIILGYAISDILRMENNTYSNALIGVIIIEVIKLVPRLGWGMSFVVIPIFSLGLLSTGMINGFWKKVFYELPFRTFDDQKADENTNLKKIILGEKNEGLG